MPKAIPTHTTSPRRSLLAHSTAELLAGAKSVLIFPETVMAVMLMMLLWGVMLFVVFKS